MTIVHTQPVISAVHVSSNSAMGPGVAANGDVITLTFTTDELVTKLGSFKINGSNPDAFSNVGNVYTATHLVDSGDRITGAPATFQINVKNAAGIFSQTIEVTSDSSSVTIGYTVTYNGNGASSGATPANSNTYHTGDRVTVMGNVDLVKTGYTFAGWNTQADDGGTSYVADTMFGITLYAKWIPVT